MSKSAEGNKEGAAENPEHDTKEQKSILEAFEALSEAEQWKVIKRLEQMIGSKS